MRAAPSLHELQQQFMAALYDPAAPGPLHAIAGHGLAPAARMRIYRRSCNETQTAALRVTYPAVAALVGEAYFEQAARGYRRAYPSRSGNLQAFGDAFAAYLETLPGCRSLPYLPDVARLEWLRQLTILAPESAPLDPEALASAIRSAGDALRPVTHPSLHLLASRHPALTIWNYALHPIEEKLTLDGAGESVALWREDGEVTMAALDPASSACIDAIMRGAPLGAAHRLATVADPGFELDACLASLVEHGLVIGFRPYAASIAETRT